MRINFAGDVQSIDMDRLAGEGVGHLFAFHNQELFIRPVQGIQSFDLSEEVVVSKHQKLITVLAIPGNDLIGSRITVAVQRVGVSVAFVPASLGRS